MSLNVVGSFVSLPETHFHFIYNYLETKCNLVALYNGLII